LGGDFGDWLDNIIAGLSQLTNIKSNAATELQSQVVILLASIDITPDTANVGHRTGALFLGWSRVSSPSDADRFEHTAISAAFVFHRAGYPPIGRLSGNQRRVLKELWDNCSHGIETEPESIGGALRAAFYPRV
jgi:hypothetical protein